MESVRKMIFSIENWLPLGTLARYLTPARPIPVKIFVLDDAARARAHAKQAMRRFSAHETREAS